MSHRVGITGIGVCTGVGCGVKAFWANLTAGRSGVSVVTTFDAHALPVRIGGEVKDLDLDRLLSEFPEAAGERDRKIWLGLDAAAQALSNSGLDQHALTEALLIIGVSLETFFLNDVSPIARAGEPASALRDILHRPDAPRLQTPLDRLTQILGDHYHMRGGRSTNCSACAAGAQAIGEAFRRIRDGAATVALAGASDSVLNPLAMGGFSLLQILSSDNETPERACRPFDATRRGTVLGEGAAFLVLESLEQARQRGATVYAEVLGYGSSLDAYRVTDPEPDGKGAVLSMRRALADAGLQPEAIDGVNAHGTGTLKNDAMETRALKQALGTRAMQIPVTANKSMTGHLIAASGAVEAAASALTLFTGTVPPTINLANRDPECDLDYVAEGRRAFYGRTVLSNSFGFGGQNATLIFGKYVPPGALPLGAPASLPACAPSSELAGTDAGAPGKTIMTYDELLTLLRSRRSIRRFSGKSVARADLLRVLEAARWAPSNHNRQPWKFIVLEDMREIARLAEGIEKELTARAGDLPAVAREHAGELVHYATFFAQAPVLIVALHRWPISASKALMAEAVQPALISGEPLSVAMAVQNLLLAAQALGLGACILTAPLLAQEFVRRELNLPAGCDPTCFVALGYPAEEPPPPRRKKIEQIVEFRNDSPGLERTTDD